MDRKPKTPWPTKDVMDQIYELNLWGGKEFDFYSGAGSHNPKIINPYIESVMAFFKTFKEPLVVCDLGCGDFNIGKQLLQCTKKYIAIDIVESLINRNRTLYKQNHLEFHCLDIAKDELPPGDCIILRQVLQHLSNTEIQNVLNKISVCKYIMLTEHLPLDNFTPNKDMISGQGIRLKQTSGVNILEAPFNFKIKDAKIINEYILENSKGRIVTTLYNVF